MGSYDLAAAEPDKQEGTQWTRSIGAVHVLHGGLLSLNAWKLGPSPQNIEVAHSNEPSNRCPLEPAVHEVHET